MVVKFSRWFVWGLFFLISSAEADLRDLLEQAKQEAGARRDIALRDIVDYSLLRRVAKEIGA